MGDLPPQLILLGPPGVGKGTQATRLATRLGLVHVSPGQILSEAARTDTPSGERIGALMSAGDQVPDEAIDRLVWERLGMLSPGQGFVLDGYPRTPAEARSLRETLAELGRLERSPIVVW